MSTNTTVEWRGLTLSGEQGATFGITSLEGWEGLPAARADSPARPQGHGRFDGPVWSDERIVTVGGRCRSAQERDELLAELGDVMTWPSGRGSTEPLIINHAGRQLTGYARLNRYTVNASAGFWAQGYFGWAAEWRCPDPLRYGDPVSSVTGFRTRGAGLQFPLYSDGATAQGHLVYGGGGVTGRASLANPGNADTWSVFQIDGPVDASGFDLIEVGTGRTVRYRDDVPAGSVLVIDSGTGSAVIDGVADRSGRLTIREWFPALARSTVEVEFVRRGVYTDATLTAVTRPGWW